MGSFFDGAELSAGTGLRKPLFSLMRVTFEGDSYGVLKVLFSCMSLSRNRRALLGDMHWPGLTRPAEAAHVASVKEIFLPGQKETLP
jgi:hypothetical protein